MATVSEIKPGAVFGRLTIVSTTRRQSRLYANVVCSCGKRKCVKAYNVASGYSTSCGCYQREHTAEVNAVKRSKPSGQSAMSQLFGVYACCARKRNLSFKLTKDEFKAITSSNCHYCGIPPSKVNVLYSVGYKGKKPDGYPYNGVDRVDNAEGYFPENCVPCCYQCNRAKGQLPVEDFLAWARRLVGHTL